MQTHSIDRWTEVHIAVYEYKFKNVITINKYTSVCQIFHINRTNSNVTNIPAKMDG